MGTCKHVQILRADVHVLPVIIGYHIRCHGDLSTAKSTYEQRQYFTIHACLRDHQRFTLGKVIVQFVWSRPIRSVRCLSSYLHVHPTPPSNFQNTPHRCLRLWYLHLCQILAFILPLLLIHVSSLSSSLLLSTPLPVPPPPPLSSLRFSSPPSHPTQKRTQRVVVVLTLYGSQAPPDVRPPFQSSTPAFPLLPRWIYWTCVIVCVLWGSVLRAFDPLFAFFYFFLFVEWLGGGCEGWGESGDGRWESGDGRWEKGREWWDERWRGERYGVEWSSLLWKVSEVAAK